jgi:hypothetical protein
MSFLVIIFFYGSYVFFSSRKPVHFIRYHIVLPYFHLANSALGSYMSSSALIIIGWPPTHWLPQSGYVTVLSIYSSLVVSMLLWASSTQSVVTSRTGAETRRASQSCELIKSSIGTLERHNKGVSRLHKI